MPDDTPTSPDDPAWVDDIVRRALERAGAGETAEATTNAPAPPAPAAAPPAPTAPAAAPPAPTPPAPTAPVAAPPAPTPPAPTPPAPTPPATAPPTVPPPETTPIAPAPVAPVAPAPAPPAPSPVAPAPEPAPPVVAAAGAAAIVNDDPRLPEPEDFVSSYPLDSPAPMAGSDAPGDGAGRQSEDELWEAAIALDEPQPDPDADPPPNRMRGFLEWGAVVLGALAVALVIKTFLMQAYFIPSESMTPTLEVGDRVLVNKLSYSFGDVGRGDLIVFNRPPSQVSGEDDLIKRVIALEGETIEIRDNTVFITQAGSDAQQRLEEPYIEPGTAITGLVDTSGCDDPTPTTCTIPADHVFVMGDNRPGSRDSRFFGPVDEDLIVGRAFLRVWPIGSISFL